MAFKKGNTIWKLRKTTGAPKGTKPWNTGRRLPQWVRDKISKSHMGKVAWNKGISGVYKASEKTKALLSAQRKGKPKSPAFKKMMSTIQTANWKKGDTGLSSKERSTKIRIARLNQKNIPNHNTSIELKIRDLLDSLKYDYIQQYNLDNRFSCDFYLPKYNLVIECDGTYWHSLPLNKKYDERKNQYCREKRILLLRLHEGDIKYDIIKCYKLILAHTKNKFFKTHEYTKEELKKCDG